ncbi:MAG: KamA family radical SAM protein [Nitrospinaceae bacterium]|nr:KamA family radical SAM protein [Nitrospinaceae bacterium]NIR55806.1 KamA family radical SAM protein [Nitrospinaceae bacterium]NIS86259.1 KamA family radical SAM protein [Nitrospinaceae bacterium]NIT83088.1 KamA family radical SAM protein [Nitrospinaceae bacterium]NIU45298.1 KamA family radical SAM protein [Nitrospinaceae bacterium]
MTNNNSNGNGIKKVKYLTRLEQIPELSQGEINRLEEVNEKFVFRTNDYYQSLINWKDPDDPIRRIVMPEMRELDDWGRLDASNEESFTVAKGLEHKYDSTALLLVNEVCAAYCRFCFRKRLFMDENEEVTKDVSEGLEYIRSHPEINNVLLTGGDPLIMSTSKLEPIIQKVREVEHVNIIRIGTKIPAFNPMRIYNDPSLAEMFRKYSTTEKRIYVMAHFNHPRELTEEAVRGLSFLLNAGAIVVNQTPMIAGVNDDPQVLADMFNKLSYIGVPPYYVFQCRPTLGNRIYVTPLEEAFEIFETARTRCSGLAKRARLVMSHATGKIEIIGLTEKHIHFKYLRAANEENDAKFMVFKRQPEAFWFDDYTELVDEYSPVTEPAGVDNDFF